MSWEREIRFRSYWHTDSFASKVTSSVISLPICHCWAYVLLRNFDWLPGKPAFPFSASVFLSRPDDEFRKLWLLTWALSTGDLWEVGWEVSVHPILIVAMPKAPFTRLWGLRSSIFWIDNLQLHLFDLSWTYCSFQEDLTSAVKKSVADWGNCCIDKACKEMAEVDSLSFFILKESPSVFDFLRFSVLSSFLKVSYYH